MKALCFEQGKNIDRKDVNQNIDSVGPNVTKITERKYGKQNKIASVERCVSKIDVSEEQGL